MGMIANACAYPIRVRIVKFPFIVSFIVFLLCGNSSSLFAQREILVEDFESFDPAKPFPGQGNWQKSHMTAGEVKVVEEGGKLRVESSTGDNEYCQLDNPFFKLTPASVVTLEFDFYLESEQSSAALGIGPNGMVSPYAGAVTGNLCIRGLNWGKDTPARTSSGEVYRATPTKWQRIRSTWNLGDNEGLGSGTLAIKDADADDSSYIPLYFDREQTQTSAPLEIDEQWPVKIWSRVWFRLSDAKIDNIKITVE